MTLRFRSLAAILLALMLALTGQSMAVARAATDPAGQMVLCTGQGPVVVFVDEDGQPVGPPHICPDCALTLLAELAPHQPLPEPARNMRLLEPAVDAVETGQLFLPYSSARAPPGFV